MDPSKPPNQSVKSLRDTVQRQTTAESVPLLSRILRNESLTATNSGSNGILSGVISLIAGAAASQLILVAVAATAAAFTLKSIFDSVTGFFKKTDPSAPVSSSDQQLISPGNISNTDPNGNINLDSVRPNAMIIPSNTPGKREVPNNNRNEGKKNETEGETGTKPSKNPTAVSSPVKSQPIGLANTPNAVSASPPTIQSSPINQYTPVSLGARPTNTVSASSADVNSSLGQIITKASELVGVPASLMLAKAKQESGFRINAKAGTSSARGLFQFITSTWNSMVDKYGKQYSITKDQINDPWASSVMAAQYLKDNIQVLKNNGISKIGYTEGYMTHFLGGSGAVTMLKNLSNSILGTQILPKAAASNKPIFYEKNGTPRTTQQIYDYLYSLIVPNANAYASFVSQQSTQTNSYTTAEYSAKNKVINTQLPANAAQSSTVPTTRTASADTRIDIIGGKIVIDASRVTRG